MPGSRHNWRYCTPQQLISEGVIELGRIGSLAYVLTNKKLRVMHAESIPTLNTPDRRVTEGVRVTAIDVGCV